MTTEEGQTERVGPLIAERGMEMKRQILLREFTQRLVAGPGGSILFHVVLVLLLVKFAMTGKDLPPVSYDTTVTCVDASDQEAVLEKNKEAQASTWEPVPSEGVSDRSFEIFRDLPPTFDPTSIDPGPSEGLGGGDGKPQDFASLAKNPDGSPTFPVDLNVQRYALATLVATLTGIGAAVFPARRAARMDPAEVIRYG